LDLLLGLGMDINAAHRVEDDGAIFPATPLWYAYARGRNEALYKRLLNNGAKPDNCWWAIAWYDDVAAAELWLEHGAVINRNPSPDELFVGGVPVEAIRIGAVAARPGCGHKRCRHQRHVRTHDSRQA
jgi:hypothetical protein